MRVRLEIIVSICKVPCPLIYRPLFNFTRVSDVRFVSNLRNWLYISSTVILLPRPKNEDPPVLHYFITSSVIRTIHLSSSQGLLPASFLSDNRIHFHQRFASDAFVEPCFYIITSLILKECIWRLKMGAELCGNQNGGHTKCVVIDAVLCTTRLFRTSVWGGWLP
jgi:hypothetical protein